MEIVVAFADGDKSGNEMVSWCVFVIEGSVSEPVCKRVDAESGVVDEEKSGGTGEEEASTPVIPQKSSDGSGEEESHANDERQVPPVLPSDDGIGGQIRHVGNTRLPATLEDHPSDVRPPETLVCAVRVEFGVGVAEEWRQIGGERKKS